MVEVNYLAVLAGAVCNMVLGFLWYVPLFGKQWMRLSGFTPERIAEAKANNGKGMGKSYALAFIGALVMAFVLSHMLVFATAYLNTEGVSAGLSTGFWAWLGFVAPITLGSVLWEQKSWKLWVLTNSYYLLTLLVMGTILAVWK